MKTIYMNHLFEIPRGYSGMVEHANGDKYWFLNGELHREDGPAIEHANGTKIWYRNGETYSFEEFFELTTDEGREALIWRMDEYK